MGAKDIGDINNQGEKGGKMKKKIVFGLAFALCVLTASALGRKKYGSFTKYEDKKNGYSGWVSVEYEGTTEETDVYSDMLGLRYLCDGSIISKITNEEISLAWMALEDSYDYKKGEVYNVTIRKHRDDFDKFLVLFVVITSKSSFEWCGFRRY